MATSDLKRLRFAQNSFIDVERCGGVIVGGTAPEWVKTCFILWSEVALGKPVTIYHSAEPHKAPVKTRPLESMVVL